MNVKRKFDITNAFKYERGKGLEDGFIYGIESEQYGFVETSKNDKASNQYAYIEVRGKKLIVTERDYIVSDANGNRDVMNELIFEEFYEICDRCDNLDTCPHDRVVRHEQTMDSLIHRLDNLETNIDKLHNMMINDANIGSLVNAGL